MKRLFTALICAMMVLGVGGCGSKSMSPEDIYEKLKSENYVFENSTDYFSAKGDKYTVFSSDYTSNQGFIFSIEKNGNEAVQFDNVLYWLPRNGKVERIARINDCMVDVDTRKRSENPKFTDHKCKNADIDSALELSKEILSYVDELGVTDKELIEFAEWYFEENK